MPTATSDGGAATPEVYKLIELVQQLSALMKDVPLEGGLDVEPTPSIVRALENLLITARSLESLSALIERSIEGQGKDLTESAAVHVRQIVEMYGETIWMLHGDQPADARALRAELSNTQELTRKVSKMVDEDPGFPVSDRKAAERKLSELQAEEAELEEAIQAQGVQPKGRPDMTSVLTKSAVPPLAFYWSYQSDVAHGGSMARNRSRQSPLEIERSAPASRRAELLSVGIVASSHLFDLVLGLVDPGQAWSAGLRDRLNDEVVQPYQALITNDT